MISPLALPTAVVLFLFVIWLFNCLNDVQTLIEIGSEQNTTTVSPLPLDLPGGPGRLAASAVPRAGAQ